VNYDYISGCPLYRKTLLPAVLDWLTQKKWRHFIFKASVTNLWVDMAWHPTRVEFSNSIEHPIVCCRGSGTDLQFGPPYRNTATSHNACSYSWSAMAILRCSRKSLMHHYILEEQSPQFHHCKSYSHTKYLSPLFTSKPLQFITKHHLNIYNSSAVDIHFTEDSHHTLCNSQWTLRSDYEHLKTHRGTQKHLLRACTTVSMSVLMVICTLFFK